MNNSVSNLSASWTTQQQFWAYIDPQGNIVTQDQMQGARAVGVVFDRYQQMEKMATEATSKAEEYKKQLIDAGIIKVPPTPEEQIAALTAQVEKLTAIITNQNEGKQNGHHRSGEINSSGEQPVDAEDRASTANGEPVSAEQKRPRPASGSVRKI